MYSRAFQPDVLGTNPCRARETETYEVCFGIEAPWPGDHDCVCACRVLHDGANHCAGARLLSISRRSYFENKVL